MTRTGGVHDIAPEAVALADRHHDAAPGDLLLPLETAGTPILNVGF